MAFAGGTGRVETSGCSWRAPGFQQADNEPVVCVSWDDAQAYAQWLSQQTSYVYRLPSEAEWEYAARGGTTTARWWGDEIGEGRTVCFNCGSRWDHRSTAPAASFPPNAFGVYDTLGNVWFWTQDCWTATLAERPRDDRAVLTGNCNRRIVRGGSWQSPSWAVRAAHRDWEDAGNREDDVGFVVVRELTH
jgi:formylglycine-generating enzyme required for sulfatase activity